MKKYLYLIPWVVLSLLILQRTSILYGATKTRFSIVYTNDVMGEVEPCG